MRILLAEDHTIVREGLRALLVAEGFDVVAEVADGRAAIDSAKLLKPDIAILDIAMPALNGIDATREIVRASPSTRIILLTVFKENQYIIEALRAGASGYLVKTKASRDLVQAIREVSKGALYLSPGLPRDVLNSCLEGREVPADPLSP